MWAIPFPRVGFLSNPNVVCGGNVAELRYYAYGKPRYNAGGQKTDYRFTGQRWQNDLGMYWYNSRWYDQLTGRFLQPDTIVPQPGNPGSLNHYSYALDNLARHARHASFRPSSAAAAATGAQPMAQVGCRARHRVSACSRPTVTRSTKK